MRTRGLAWGATYRRMAIGLLVSFVTLTLGNAEIWQGSYQSASPDEAFRILPLWLGFTELLIETAREPQAKRDLGQVRSEAIRAGRIVRNLLAFVRRSSSERSLASLNAIVRTTMR